MDILNHSYGVHSEIDRQYYVFNLQNLYILGILISGFIWPWFVKILGNYKSVFLSYFLISFLYFVLSFVRSIHAFMAVTFFIGISQNTFSVGNAFIYDFIKKEFLNYMFITLQIFGIVFGKVFPYVGKRLYEYYSWDV